MKQGKQIMRDFVMIGGKEYPAIKDVTILGDWEEVQAVTKTAASVFTKQESDTEILDGLIIRGYEMKWGQTNENGERYEKTAFDKFINEYFVQRNLNMVVDINHEGYYNYKAQCGRVLYIETNSVGFYFVIYVPRGFDGYNDLKWRLEHKLIQGFSKEGYATEWEYIYDENGQFDYELIKEMKLLSVSLVSTPANGIAFEKMQEIKNGLQYVNKTINQASANTMDDMFNK